MGTAITVIIILLVVVVGHRPRRLSMLQRLRQVPQPDPGVLAPGRRRAQPALRADPEPGRDRPGVRGPRAEHARGRHPAAQPGPADRPVRQGGLPSQQRAEVEEQLSGAVRNLIVSVEAYPDLKSNQNFLELQRSWPRPRTGSPTAGATTTPTSGSTTPGSSRCRATSSPVFKFEKATYFEVNDPAVRQAPSVSFGEIAYRGDQQQQPAPSQGQLPQQGAPGYDNLPNPQQQYAPPPQQSPPQQYAPPPQQTYAPPAPQGQQYQQPQYQQPPQHSAPPQHYAPPQPQSDRHAGQPELAAALRSRPRPAAGSPAVKRARRLRGPSSPAAHLVATSRPTPSDGDARVTYRQLGTSGLTVSVVGTRVQQLRRADGRRGRTDGGRRRHRRRHHPVRHRRRVRQRRWLGDPARAGAEGQARRGGVATKFGMDMGGANGPDWGVRGSRRYIRLAVEASLRRLETDWIDLYQLHRPDPHTPIEETLAALTDLVHRGQGPLPRLLELRRLAGGRRRLDRADRRSRARSSPRRTSTPGSPAGSRPSWSRPSSTPAGACCRTSRWPRGLLTGKYQRGADAPAGTRLAAQPDRAGRGRLRHDRGAAVVRRRARADHAAGRDRRPGGDADRRFGDRRRDVGRPDRGQRRGRALAAQRRGPADAGRPDRLNRRPLERLATVEP